MDEGLGLTVGTRDGVSPPPGEVGIGHTHQAGNDDRLRFPSDVGGDMTSARSRNTTQAVVHEMGVTVFGPHGSVKDIQIGDSTEEGIRIVQKIVEIPTTQVTLQGDPETRSVIINPSPDNPEQTQIPVTFPRKFHMSPGITIEDVAAVRERKAAVQRERIAQHAAENAARERGAPIIGYDHHGMPVFEGMDPALVVYDHVEEDPPF